MKINVKQQSEVTSVIIHGNQYQVAEEVAKQFTVSHFSKRHFSLNISEKTFHGFFIFENEKNTIHVNINGYYKRYKIVAENQLAGVADFEKTIRATLPGKILKVLVTEKQKVKEGDPLIVQEAMKMEHTLSTSKDATVSQVFVTEHDVVEADQVLIELQ